ncbi:D-amino-acid dehydrogenase [Modicisalibacter xianhensis]|uniref:D-amino-acid dehydrogenase n=1 Tax=Modicisalibacter xianhensis TaxID=442341 RepID=A0A4V3GV00_9GAMM|nr:D-amino acid dehydrogenase [Halomonas xianhensis]TDX32184.1 D-amino-acid dehydrogenase [Halomonas xianhensis]
MRIAVIGAGVVGVTTAYALARRGHDVVVIERHAAPAEETSRGNAGQRSYGYVYPWASPAMLKKALPWLVKADGPLKMSLPPSPWTLLATWRLAKTPGLFDNNKRAMLRLGAYSRQCFLELQDTLPLAFDGGHGGLIDLASDAATAEGLKASTGLLDELGIDAQWLTPAQVYDYEPGLTGEAPLFGALRMAQDGTGDCQEFTRSLAEQCRAMGVEFRWHTEVDSATTQQGRVTGLTLRPATPAVAQIKGAPAGQAETLEADAVVLCAGCDSRTLGKRLGLRLPIYPVKGYSLTAPILDDAKAPCSTVIDDRYKVVATRLGDRLRATGFVELAELNRNIPLSRLATIRKAIISRFPGVANLDQAETWTGFRPMLPDGPPAIGRGRQENLFINTGHGTFGWTLSAASAELTGQLIDGETPALDLEAFHPLRFER